MMNKLNKSDIRPDYAVAIREKARKDVRRSCCCGGWPTEPSRQEGWSDEDWLIYTQEYTSEMHAMIRPFK